ncbi:MAG: hypothetical protein PHO48_05165 [Candidatus Gracilibacteria bacterium]|nr:hypothetical protein [Candidatus Gracilibacteria bacterium]MDD5179551.1 hypothetical protein [Candidatus Gracilibacteria bacterium]
MKYILYIIAVLVIAAAVMLTLRILSGEDSWNCENGEWVKHGYPIAPHPIEVCE